MGLVGHQSISEKDNIWPTAQCSAGKRTERGCSRVRISQQMVAR